MELNDQVTKRQILYFTYMRYPKVSSVVSDSQRPRGLQPSRPLRPWDSPGKSARVVRIREVERRMGVPGAHW